MGESQIFMYACGCVANPDNLEKIVESCPGHKPLDLLEYFGINTTIEPKAAANGTAVLPHVEKAQPDFYAGTLYESKALKAKKRWDYTRDVSLLVFGFGLGLVSAFFIVVVTKGW